jgi:HlyD family secretion protein
MKILARYLPIVLVAVAGLALLAYALWPQAVEVEVVTVTRGPMQLTVDEDGKTRVKERYIVSAPLSGQLGRVELHPGDVVEAGKTVLATIQSTDPALLDARLLAEADSRVKAAEAAQEQAVARLDAAREAQHLAEEHFKRAQKLSGTKAISQAEFDNAEHQQRIALVMLRAAEFGHRVSTFELALAQAAFVRTRPNLDSETESQRLEIHSPVDGKVFRVIQESATVVATGKPLIEIGNTRELELEIDVLSADAAQITPGAKVLLEHWGGANPLVARVRLVEPSGFTKISALGVEEQRVNVIADFEEPVERFSTVGDAFRVEARIVVWETADSVKVPSGALFRHGTTWAVFVVSNRRARLRTVRIGHNNGQEAEVLGGLSPGEEVVAYPSDDVRDGVRVSTKGNSSRN